MRTYGRVTNSDGSKTWVVVQTDANGFDDLVWLTTMIQVFKLNLGESPFFGNYGIPAEQSVVTQVFPDFYVNFTQQAFASHFASLIVYRKIATGTKGERSPVYFVNCVTQYGARLTTEIAT